MPEREKPPRVVTATRGADGLLRCPWPGADPLYVAYHDEEWGVPEYDDRAMFEKLVLDGFQAGLSWITILRKRPAFRKAFDGFDPKKIARWSEKKKDALMQDAGIVRNRAKIEATVALARITLDLAEKGGLARHLWSFVDGRPIQNERRSMAEMQAESEVSQRHRQGPARRAAAISSGRRSSTPSCRRPAWSTTISSIAAVTRPAGRWRASSSRERGRDRAAPGSGCCRGGGSTSSTRRRSTSRSATSPMASRGSPAGTARPRGPRSSRSPSIRCWSRRCSRPREPRLPRKARLDGVAA